MNKNARPEGLAVRFFLAGFVLLFIAGVSGCNPNGGEQKPPTTFNADTVRNHIISVAEAKKLFPMMEECKSLVIPMPRQCRPEAITANSTPKKISTAKSPAL